VLRIRGRNKPSEPDAALSLPSPTIRPATVADLAPLRELQVASMRALGPGRYTPAEVEAAVRYVCVPDLGLIEDGTYLVAEQGGRLVGCGGWSLRRKAYAGPADASGDADRLDPRTEPTRIRAMFTAPDAARQGVGRAILTAAETAARAAGFGRARLGATLSGEAFYRRAGYAEIGRETARLPDGTAFAVILMEKDLGTPA
jgi:GNAT superfamily N-acetyltransferase